MIDSKILAKVILAEPLIGYYLLKSTIVCDNSMRAIACIDVVNQEIVLRVNLDKFRALTASQQTGTLIHEYLHPLLCHCDKRSFGMLSDAWRANVAQDMAINPNIARHFDLPEGAVFPDNCGYSFPKFMSAEFYFNELGKDIGKFKNTFGAPLNTPTSETLSAFGKIAIEFANSHNSNGVGLIATASGSPELTKEIIGIRNGFVDWRKEIRHFLCMANTTKYRGSFKRPSRRFGSWAPGQTSIKKSFVPVILDTSASMASKLNDAVTEILALSESTDVRLFQCDTKLLSYDEIKNQDSIEIIGGGGTNLQEAIDKVQISGSRHCLIITDEEYAVKLDTHNLRVLTWNPKNGQIRAT